ncbi:hypothetical protein OT109_01550 [Phycisphaeraceae bacterium D3-23]
MTMVCCARTRSESSGLDGRESTTLDAGISDPHSTSTDTFTNFFRRLPLRLTKCADAALLSKPVASIAASTYDTGSAAACASVASIPTIVSCTPSRWANFFSVESCGSFFNLIASRSSDATASRSITLR